MTGTDITRASSTESPNLERGSVQDVRTFRGTLSRNVMICCDRVAAGMTINRQQIAYNRAGVIMLLSHCGEYMANGLTNAVRHEFVIIANDRQTFVAVRKHSRSFLWWFECYAGLTSGECMANGMAYECHSPSIRNDRKVIARIAK